MNFKKIINAVTCIFTPDETVLSKYNDAHWILVNSMRDALYEIWEYSKGGNVEAYDFMHSKLRDRLVQFRLDFVNDDIPSFHKRATYKEYKSIMAEVKPLLYRLRRDGAV